MTGLLASLPFEAKTILAVGGLLVIIIGHVWQLRQGASSMGLVAAYLANLFLLHVFFPVVCLFPGATYNSAVATEAGLEIAVLAILGLAVGLFWGWRRARREEGAIEEQVEGELGPSPVIVWRWLGGLSIASTVLLMTLSSVIPGIAALSTAGMGLLIPVMIDVLRHDIAAGRPAPFLRHSLPLLLLPVLSLLGIGFLGYAFAILLAIGAGVLVKLRRSSTLMLGFPVVLYLGISVYAGYMGVRTSIRDAVWGGSRLEERVRAAAPIVTEFRLFDPTDDEHRQVVDLRLNQDWLVGAARDHIERGSGVFVKGETILSAFFALIPRALWPDKPDVGGSGDLVTRFTGIEFAEGTSVGVGQVLEMYANFGQWGVLLLSVLLGAGLAMLDSHAGASLDAGDFLGALSTYLPGMALLNVGGSFSETIVSFVAACLVAYGLRRWLGQRGALAGVTRGAAG